VKNKCLINSSESQNTHFLQPFHFRLARLSLVRVTFFIKKPREDLYVKRYYNLPNVLRKKTVCQFIISSYIDFTEKVPKVLSFQTKISKSSVELIDIKRCSKSNQTSQLLPVKVLQNSIFRGTPVNISKTKTFFHRMML
jgi:hypothetical protein